MIFERQDYQQDCINNIINLLRDFDFKKHGANNLKEIFYTFQKENPNIFNFALSDKLNIDILMETGTGKTFTYLNLIFEMSKIYKQNKFIIFVPRKAILETVKQNIKLTKDYFFNQYKKHLKTYTYTDSKSLGAIINHYIKNTEELSVLILTNSAMDKKLSILNRNSESLFNTKSVFENIADLKPISIIDEPHLLKGEAFNKYFNKINSLYFRFGATFPKEKVLEDMVNAALSDFNFEEVKDLEIIDPYNLSENIDLKESIIDIPKGTPSAKAKTKDNQTVANGGFSAIIEIQLCGNIDFLKRIFYYISKNIINELTLTAGSRRVKQSTENKFYYITC